MKATTIKKIEEFLNSIEIDNLDIMKYVTIEDIDMNNPFQSIFEQIRDEGGFDVEIIFFNSAMDYLKANDPSLQESLEIAHGYGFSLDKLNSEKLASLLASRNCESDFYEYEDDINEFFQNL